MKYLIIIITILTTPAMALTELEQCLTIGKGIEAAESLRAQGLTREQANRVFMSVETTLPYTRKIKMYDAFLKWVYDEPTGTTEQWNALCLDKE